ncbi:MAG: succinate dehydrogenase assembly factor 2 [Pseudomonadota bacterium]|nr:succinate dehydrogenase assembly factor 2 [Pseudomonadota bacterium]
MEEDERKALWRSRRGLLELDLILVPFVENCFASLPERLRRDYLDLLTVDDVDAYAWLTSGEGVPSRYKQIVDVIKRFVGGET